MFEINKKTLKHLFIVVAAGIILYWILHDTERVAIVYNLFKGILGPFVLGAGLAFVLNVPMRSFERIFSKIKHEKFRRVVAIILTFIAVLLVLALVFWLLIPQLIETVNSLVPALQEFFVKAEASIVNFLNQNPELMEWISNNTNFENFDFSSILQKAISILGTSVSSILSGAFSAIGTVFGGIVNFVIALVFAIYALFQKETLARQGRKVVYSILPEKTADYIVKVLRLTNSTFSNFLSGQCVEVCILGSLFAVTMAIFNLGREYIALISVLVAVTAFIPVVGAWTGCIVGGFLIMVSSSFTDALWFVVLSIVVQQVENNFIYPRVVGTSIGLSGMWVLVAVAIGGQIGGVVGMFLMIPVTSVIYVLIREAVQNRLGNIEVAADKLEPQPPELRSHIKEKRAHKKMLRLHKKQSKETNKK